LRVYRYNGETFLGLFQAILVLPPQRMPEKRAKNSAWKPFQSAANISNERGFVKRFFEKFELFMAS